MADWQTKSSEIVYETPWIKVHRDEVITQTGAPLTYSYMELQNPSVFIVAVNAEGKILLQNTYRYPVRQRIWETPAGYMNPGEEPLAAAQRELQEETGLVSDDWHDLGRIYQIIGTGNVPVQAFLARNVTKTGEATDKEEDIQNQQFKSLDKIEDMIRRSELIDSPVIGIIYMAKLFGITKEEA